MSHNTLQVDEEYFLKQGYSSINLTVILREKIDSIKTWMKNGKIVLPKELNAFLPMGNPPSFFAGTCSINNKTYASIFLSKDIAVHLLLYTDNTEHEHLGNLLPSFYENLEVLLQRQKLIENGIITFKPTKHRLNFLFTEINNIDGVIFSILTKKPTIIIGSYKQLINFFTELFYIIPQDYVHFYNFIINITPNDIPIPLIGVSNDFFEKHQSSFESFFMEHEDVTIVNLNNETAETNFEVNLFKQLKKNLETVPLEKSLDFIQQNLKELFSLASTLPPASSISELAEAMNNEYDVAELIHLLMNIIR